MEHFNDSYRNIIQDEDIKPTPKTKEKQFKKIDGDFYNHSNLIKYKLFSRLELDTLFVIFYFQKDQYERLLAAKELKIREWSFNKKYLVWFKRHGRPKELHTMYEKGDYLIFDSEDKWKIKKKTDFLFE